jgi:hypothetical protein
MSDIHDQIFLLGDRMGPHLCKPGLNCGGGGGGGFEKKTLKKIF